MMNKGAAAADIEAVIGPSIQQASYQVGDDLRTSVLAADNDADHFFSRISTINTALIFPDLCNHACERRG